MSGADRVTLHRGIGDAGVWLACEQPAKEGQCFTPGGMLVLIRGACNGVYLPFVLLRISCNYTNGVLPYKSFLQS